MEGAFAETLEFVELKYLRAFSLQEVARELRKFNYNAFKDADLKRKIKKLTDLGYAALSEDKFTQLLDAISSMSENYAMAKVCDYKDRTKCDLSLEPELTETLATSRDPEELKHYWIQWYDAAGAPTRENFQKYVELNKEAAELNGKVIVTSHLNLYSKPNLSHRFHLGSRSLVGRLRG